MPCLTPEQIKSLARGELPAGQAEEIGRHVDECEACRRTLDEYLAGDELLRGLRGSADSSPAMSSPEPSGEPSPDATDTLAPRPAGALQETGLPPGLVSLEGGCPRTTGRNGTAEMSRSSTANEWAGRRN